MRILVTGGAGFIGSHLADAYLAAGEETQSLVNAQEALRVAEEIGQSVELAASYRILGDVWLAKGDALQAKDYYEKSIHMLQELEEDEELTKARDGLEKVSASLRNATTGGKEFQNG